MKKEKYKIICKDLNTVLDYINNLQTILDWLKDNGVLTNEQHCSVKSNTDCYTWWCGDKSIQLNPGEAFAALKRIGFIFEEATSNRNVETDNDEPELMEVKEDINNENA